MSQQIKQKLPDEIIDKILIKIGDIDIAVQLNRYYVVKTLYKLLSHFKVDWAKEYGLFNC